MSRSHAETQNIGAQDGALSHVPVQAFGKPSEGARACSSADFRLPLHFEEEIEIELLVEELRNKTIHYYFQFWKHPDSPEERALAATGRFTVVCVSFDAETRRMKAVAIPDEWREKLKVAPEGAIPA